MTTFTRSACFMTTCVAELTLATHSLAQVGSFARITGNELVATSDTFAHIFADPDLLYDDPPEASDAHERSAAISSTAQLSTDGALASSQIASTANSVTPIGGQTSAPAVDSSLTLLQTVDVNVNMPDVYRLSVADALGSSGNIVPFEVTLDEMQETATFHGSLYLVGVGEAIEIVGPHDPPFLRATTSVDTELTINASINIGSASYGVTATYDSDEDEWSITGNLPGGITIDETAAGVNRHFNFDVPIQDGETVTMFSSTFANSGLEAEAEESNASVNLNWVLHASAWGSITPTGGTPAIGDFDGDGQVDDEDFAIWNENMPVLIGGIGPRGDANGDGAIDLLDLRVWLDNTITPGIPGDFDINERVDRIDFLAWQRGFGTQLNGTRSEGDTDADGDVDDLDLELWRESFGLMAPLPASSAVPENIDSRIQFMTLFAAISLFSRRTVS